MELLELTPPCFKVNDAGVYVLDDDGMFVLAGPFPHEKAALAWIEETQAERRSQALRNSQANDKTRLG